MDLKGHKRGVLGISFSPDSKKVATASVDGTWRLWDINVRYEMQEDPKVILSVTNPVDPALPFTHVAISPDGDCVATATANNVHFWSAKDGSLLGDVMAAHAKAISSLSWSKSGEWLASGSHDMTVGLWKRPVVSM
jgi:transducin beta-like protein 2